MVNLIKPTPRLKFSHFKIFNSVECMVKTVIYCKRFQRQLKSSESVPIEFPLRYLSQQTAPNPTHLVALAPMDESSRELLATMHDHDTAGTCPTSTTPRHLSAIGERRTRNRALACSHLCLVGSGIASRCKSLHRNSLPRNICRAHRSASWRRGLRAP